MDHTHIVTAANLDEYAFSRDSQGVIPELIYHLVKLSIPDGSVCRIPYGDAVNLPGADGLVVSQTAFREFVPQGKSYWEIGVGSDPQKKASSDFKKRTTDITTQLPEQERADSTFIFVTPHTNWSEPNQTKWLNDKGREKSDWKDIRILDGIKLADWLREFPALGHWMSKKLNLSRSSVGLNTPAEVWNSIQARVGPEDPPLPPKIFLEGRESACAALQSLFQGKKQRLLLSAESSDDVQEFVSGYLASLDKETCALYSNRCLLISEVEAWHSYAQTRRSHVLVADPHLGLDSDNLNLQTYATQNGHAVVIPICGAFLGGDHEIIRLRSPSKSRLERILLEAKYPTIRAKELSCAGADSLSALKRHLLGFGALPPYATWETARFLAQAALIGKWDGKNQADRTAIENLLGKSYGEWIETVRPETLRSGSPLTQRNEKWRMIARLEAWKGLGSYLADEDLDRLQQTALMVLSERDPQFDLPKEERYLARIHEKQLKYSSNLREGIAETLALLGSFPETLSSCSQGKAEAVAALTIQGLLEKASWDHWASLDGLLPLMAEAAPSEFLNAVESALEKNAESPFVQVFGQEGGQGIMGRIYTSGLLWGLETLAWNSDYLTRVILILGDLASIDPGGAHANRPSNSLADILLPWHLQTCAPLDKRKSAVETLLREQPNVGWNLLLALLPHNHGITSGCRRPSWRSFISANWQETVTINDYWKQIEIYADFAIGLATNCVDKLVILLDGLPDLPKTAFDKLLSHLASEEIRNLPENDLLPLWDKLNGLVRKHRRYPDASWSMPEETLAKLERIALELSPDLPELRYRPLFSGRDHDFYDNQGDYEGQSKRLAQLRQNAIQEILDSGGLDAALEFARNVSAPYQVGHALGSIATDSLEIKLLPALLHDGDGVQESLIDGFVSSRFSKLNFPWVDYHLAQDWSTSQKSSFLALLPFVEGVWSRAEKYLEAEEDIYWKNARVNPWRHRGNLLKAIEKLIKYDRPNAAVQCLHTINKKEAFPADLATSALLAVIRSEPLSGFDRDATIEVISRLQQCPTADADALFDIEWTMLPLLDEFSNGSPVTLENRLATDATFFCEIIALAFRSENEQAEAEELITEQQRNLALQAYNLLRIWKTPPGLLPDGSFDPNCFIAWLEKVKNIAQKTGYTEVALTQLGHVLTHAPKDEDGLWIHHVVAQALNEKDAKAMRSGFTTELFNQRGVYGFTAGEGELRLAQIYHEKAEALEDKGYSKFATDMREFSNLYKREAKHEAARDPFNE